MVSRISVSYVPEAVGMHWVLPIRLPFPIWRYGEHYDKTSESAKTIVGWWPDPYRYHAAQRFF